MAKKSKFELDDFGFDSELSGGEFDFEPARPEKKSSRKAALDLGKAAIRGAGSGLKDEMFIRRTLKTTLPRGYGSALDLADEMGGTLKSLYNDSAKEIKPVINDLRRATKKIQPALDKYLPKGIAKRLERFGNEADRAAQEATDAESQREAMLQSQMAEVFKHQITQTAERNREEDARSRIREEIDQTRHKANIGQLDAIRLSVSQLATYQNNVTVNFQRKSLELQYRQFFIARDMLEEVKKQGAVHLTAYEKLVRNTGLPDFVKITEAENLKQIMRNKFIDAFDNGLLGGRREFIQNLGKGIRNVVGGKVRDFAQNVQFGLSSADMAADAIQMQREMAEMGMDTGGVGGMVAGGIGAAGAQSLVGRAGKRVGKWLQNKQGLVTRGNKLAYNINSLPQRARGWAEGYGGIKYVPGFITDLLRESILGMPGLDRTLQRDNLKDMQGPAIFSRQVSKSITEVIPGYLSRIYREIQVMRTGNEKIELTGYDYHTNKFSSKSDIAKSVFNSVVSRSSGKWLNEDIDKLIDHIEGGETKFTAEQRKALKHKLLMDNLRGTSGHAEHYMDPFNYQGPAGKHAQVFADAFQNRYGDTADTTHARRVEFSNLHNPLGGNIRLGRSIIQEMYNAGMGEYLEAADFIDKNGNINTDKIAEMHLDAQAHAPQGPGAINAVRRASHKRGEGKRAAAARFSYMSTVPVSSSKSEIHSEPAYAQHPQAQQTINFDPLLAAIKANNHATLLEKANETLLRIEQELQRGLVTYSGGEVPPGAGPGGTDGRRWMDRSMRDHWTRGRQRLGELGQRAKDWFAKPGWFGKQWENRQSTWQTAKDKVGGWYGKAKDKFREMTDVYIKGEAMPRLTAWGMMMGKYRDQVTGQVIKSYKDIKGAVVDENGNVIMTLEEAKNAVAQTGFGKKVAEIGSWIKDKATQMWRQTQSIYGMGFNLAKDLAKKGMDYANAQDVYVKTDLTNPVLQATIMRAKGYVSQARKDKYILSPADIDGPVENLQGEVVLSNEQIQQGLVDRLGRPLVSGKLRLLQIGTDAVHATIDRVKNGFKMAKDWLSGKWRGFADWFKVDGIAFSGGKTIIERLTEIRDLLDDRLPNRKKKHIVGDIDGDGVREGSYEDKKKKGALHNAVGQSIEAAKTAAEAAKEKGQSLYGFLGSKAAALMDVFRKRRHRGKDGEDDKKGHSKLDTALDVAGTVADFLPFGGLLGKGARWGWRGLKGLGRAGLGRLGLGGARAAGGLAAGGAEAAEIAAAAQAAGMPAAEAAALAAEAGGAGLAGAAAGGGRLAGMAQGLGRFTGRGISAARTGMTAAADVAKARGLGGLAMQGLRSGAGMLGRGALMAGRFALPALAGGLGSSAAMGAGLFNAGMAGLGALGTGAAALGSGLLAAMASPVVLGALAVGAAGYGAYKLYKWMSQKSLTPLSKLRYVQYGFAPDDRDHFSAVFHLEDMLEKNVTFRMGSPDLSLKGIKEEDIYDLFGIDKDNKKQTSNFLHWFVQRFKPVFLVHMTALHKVDSSMKLGDVEKLKPKQQKQFFEIAKYPGGPYTYFANPFADADPLSQGKVEVAAYTEELAKKINEAAEKAGDEDKKADDKANVPESKSIAQVSAAAGMAQALGMPKDSQQANWTAIKEMKDGETGTGMSGSGAMLTMQGTFDPGSLDTSTKLDALSCIRFKTYGLKEMNISKVKALLQLENVVQKDIKVGSDKLASWSGNIQKTLSVVGASFGIDDPRTNGGYSWLSWFNNRFLPTYLNYIGALVAATKKDDPKAAVFALKPQDSLDVAEAIRGSHAKNGSGSVWTVTASPWPNYDLNTDVTSTDENVNGLKTLAVKTKLSETVGLPGAGENEGGNKPDDKSPTGFLAKTWKSLTTNADGSKNWLGRTTDAVTGAVGAAYDKAKSALGMGSPTDTAGKPVSVGTGTGGTAASLPDPKGDGSWAAMKDLITGAAKMAGVDPHLMGVMAAIESGFRAKIAAGTSTAKGLYQFIDGTWKEMLRKYGAKYGLGPNTSRDDPKANALMGAEYIKENLAYLQKNLGGNLTETHAYAAHFFGAGNALKLYKSDPNAIAASVFPTQAAKNKEIFYDRGQPRTIGGVIALFDQMVKTKGQKFGIETSGAQNLVDDKAKPAAAPATGTDASKTAAAAQTGPSTTPASGDAGNTGPTPALPKTAFDQVSGPGKPPVPVPSAATAQSQPAAPVAIDPFNPPDLGPTAAMGSGFSPMAARQATDLTSTRQAQQQAQQQALGGVGDTLTQSLGVQREMLSALNTIAQAIVKGGSVQPAAPAAEDSVVTKPPRVNTPMTKNLVSVQKPSFAQ